MVLKRKTLAFVALGLRITAFTGQNQEIPGCYTFAPYAWSNRLDRSAMGLHTPPDTFRIYATRGPKRGKAQVSYETNQLLVRPRMAKPEFGGKLAVPAAFWYKGNADSVHIVWTNGFTGAEVTARYIGDRLEGRLTAVSDEVDQTPSPHAHVVINRVHCPATLPDTVASDTVR